jgi:hypothetical protein
MKMINEEKLNEQYLDHEVRLRLNEHNMAEIRDRIKEIHNILRWILGTGLVAVMIPIILKYFKLS